MLMLLGWLLRKGYDWRGRMKYLLGRDADFFQCQIPGVEGYVVEQALSIISAAFGIPEAQRYCLRPGDSLFEIYRSITGFGDNLEFESFHLRLEEACGCEIAMEEISQDMTVGGVISLLASRLPSRFDP